MKNYLKGNLKYWQNGYNAENVESVVFRAYGRIFKYEFGLDGLRNEKLLDWGCGAGAALRFFKLKGFEVYGVDMSETDIQQCRGKMPDVADHFQVIYPKPKENQVFFGGELDIVIAIQSLYYLSDTDFGILLRALKDNMKSGAIIYATMVGMGHYLYGHSTEYEDGLRKVDFSSPRSQVKDYFLNFTYSEEHLLRKFNMFEKRHIGFYDAKYREDEGSDFHYTFMGQKT